MGGWGEADGAIGVEFRGHRLPPVSVCVLPSTVRQSTLILPPPLNTRSEHLDAADAADAGTAFTAPLRSVPSTAAGAPASAQVKREMRSEEREG